MGIALLIRPRIHPDGDVTLKTHTVVSTITGITDGLPQTANREADTTVRLHSGEELVIGGLERSDVSIVDSKVPILGDLPLIGKLFRNTHRSKSRTEILILIRSYPVNTDPAPVKDFHKMIEKNK